MALGTGLGRFAMRAGGLAIGYSAYQVAQQAMETYELRALGILQIGSMLDEQYSNVRTTLKSLGDQYFITAREGVAALTTLGRTAGAQATAPHIAERLARFGLAYGMTMPETAAHFATLSMLGATREPDLRALAAIQGEAQARGITRLPVSRFVQEAVGVAQVGGLGFAPMSETQLGRITAFMSEPGGRFAAHPAEAFAQYAGGLQAPAPPFFEALRWQAIAELAQRQRYVQLGNRRLDLQGSITDRQMAIENAAQIPEVQEAYRQMYMRQSGGNPEYGRMLRQGMFGTRTMYQTAEEFEAATRVAGREGGIVGALTAPPDIAGAEATVTGRIARRPEAEERIRRRAAEMESVSETKLIEALENFRSKIAETTDGVVKSLEAHDGALQTTTKALDSMGTDALAVSAAMSLIVAALSVASGGALAPLAVGGAVALTGATQWEMWREFLRQHGSAAGALTPNPQATQPQRPRP